MALDEIAFFAFVAVALVAAFAAQATLAAAREHVRARHPDWFARLSSGGSAMRLGGPEERARRRLIRPLLFGALPAEVAGDEGLQRIARGLRMTLGAFALACVGVVAIVAARVPPGA